MKDLDNEQTGTETRKCGPVEQGNEIRCWQMTIMMSPVVAPAESPLGSR